MILLSGPNISGNEWKYVKDCLDSAWISSVGSYVSQFEKMVADYAGAKYGVAAVNGTAALHMAEVLLDIGPGDYVITPNITFIATLNAVKYSGAEPILIDINPDTWQIDLNILEHFLEEDTYENNGITYLKEDNKPIKAIMPVHVLGNMVDMDRLLQISLKYHLEIIEDAAEAMGSYYKDKHAGSFGRIGCFSFNGNKIITTGGGGVIVTDDEKLAIRAKHLTTQAKADPLYYFHDEIGYNFRLTNIAAAIGVAQMEQLDDFVKRKHEIANCYIKELSGIGDIKFQKIENDVKPNWWLFTIETEYQNQLLKHLNTNNIQSRPLWTPMNQLPMFKNNIYVNNENISQKIHNKCISIPCSTYITDEELQSIIDTIKKIY